MIVSAIASDARQRAIRRLLAALMLLLALTLAWAAESTLFTLTAGASPAPEPRRYTLRGEKVAIYNLAGKLEVIPGAGAEVVVEVTPAGRDADRLRIETGPLRGETTLRVRYPGNRVVYSEIRFRSTARVRMRDDGTFGSRDRHHDGLPSWLGGPPTVTVRGSGSGLEAHADVRVMLPRGQHLDVHVAAGAAEVRNVEGDLYVDGALSPVTVDGVRGTLAVDVGSGDVDVKNVAGALSIDTGSGDVSLSKVRGSRIVIDTGSGSVEGDELAGEKLSVDTGSGRVRLGAVNAPDVLVDTGSGSVDLEIVGELRSLVVDTGSGGVNLGVPPALGAEIEVETGSGGIHADLPVHMVRREGSYFLGRIGDGRGRIRIDTGSGGVRLRAI